MVACIGRMHSGGEMGLPASVEMRVQFLLAGLRSSLIMSKRVCPTRAQAEVRTRGGKPRAMIYQPSRMDERKNKVRRGLKDSGSQSGNLQETLGQGWARGGGFIGATSGATRQRLRCVAAIGTFCSTLHSPAAFPSLPAERAMNPGSSSLAVQATCKAHAESRGCRRRRDWLC
jgi:hypothetical protein